MPGRGKLQLGIRRVCRHGLETQLVHLRRVNLLGKGIRVDLDLIKKASSESKAAPFDSAHSWDVGLAKALVKKLVRV